MAGRIPQSFIQDILTRTDIVELLSARIALKKRGSNYLGLCPFHQEKTPSFTVSAEKQFYYCFGCQAHGNAIGFLMAFDRFEFVDAVAYLASQLGLSVPTAIKETHGQVVHAAETQQADYLLLSTISQYYQQQLRQSPSAIHYLKSRGITGEIAKQFAIGYAPADWENLKTIIDHKQIPQLITHGLVIQKEHSHCFDRFRDRIIFPIRDVRGRVIAFGGRTLGHDLPKYMNSPETPTFHKSHELYGLYETRLKHRELPRIIIVEGYLDVISLHQHHITYAVATLGTAINRQHIQKLLRYTNELIFCFDGDTAGRKAGWRALTLSLPLMHDGIHIRFLFLPQSEDPDSWIRKIGYAGFVTALKQAQPLSDVFFEQLLQQIPLRSIDDKAHFAKQACQYIETMPHGLFRQFLLEQLATRLAVDPAELERLCLSPSPPLLSQKTTQPVRSQNRRLLSPDYLAIALLLAEPELVKTIGDLSDLAVLQSPGIPLLLKLVTWLHQTSITSTGILLEQWPDPDERPQLAALAARYLTLKAHDLKSELIGAIERLREQQAQTTIQELIQKSKLLPLSPAEKETLQQLLVLYRIPCSQ